MSLISLPYELIHYIFGFTGAYYIFGRLTCKCFADLLKKRKVNATELFKRVKTFKYMVMITDNANKIADYLERYCDEIVFSCETDMLQWFMIFLHDPHNRNSLYGELIRRDEFDAFNNITQKDKNYDHLWYIALLHRRWRFVDQFIVKHSIPEDLMDQIVSKCKDDEYFRHVFQKNTPVFPNYFSKAARLGNLAFLKYISERGFKLPYKTLQYAAARGHLECVEWLLEKGVKAQSWGVHEAIVNNRKDIVERIYNSERNREHNRAIIKDVITDLERVGPVDQYFIHMTM